MNEKVLHTLEYNKILDQLTEYAFSADARSRCQKLRPITDRAQIEQLQQQTSDALSRLFKYGSLSFSGVTDIRDSLKRLEIGGALSAIELLRVCSLLESAKRAKAFARSQEDNDQPDDSLTGLFAGIEPLTPLYDEIRRCILSEDEIADDASSTLHSIRRSMRGMNDKIRAPDELHDQQHHDQKLSAGHRHYHARRALLSPGQSGGKVSRSRHDP